MNIFNMMGKIGELKKSLQATKERLDHVLVDGKSEDGNVTATLTANLEVRKVQVVKEYLKTATPEQLEFNICSCMNNAISAAKKVSEAELKAAGKDMLPDLPGLF